VPCHTVTNRLLGQVTCSTKAVPRSVYGWQHGWWCIGRGNPSQTAPDASRTHVLTNWRHSAFERVAFVLGHLTACLVLDRAIAAYPNLSLDGRLFIGIVAAIDHQIVLSGTRQGVSDSSIIAI
jgi:hypothetical protein